MNSKIILAIIGVLALGASAAFAFSSVTPTPGSYDIGVVSGGDTEIVDVTLRNTNDEPVDVQMYAQVAYTGDCDGRGAWQNNTDMVMSYCDADGDNCDQHKIFSIPEFGNLNIKVRHDANIAACPGTYKINNTIQFVEQELPLATAFGYFHDGRAQYKTPKGNVRIFRKLNTLELRLELNSSSSGFQSRRCNIISDRMTFLSRRIICESPEAGHLTIFMMPQARLLTVGYGNKIYFRGMIVPNI